jgi:hypothetical protein
VAFFSAKTKGWVSNQIPNPPVIEGPLVADSEHSPGSKASGWSTSQPSPSCILRHDGCW